MVRNPRSARGFTLIELIAVIVILGILSGLALPRYFDHAAEARESACKGALGGVRAAVANWYVNTALTGTPTYPTIGELTTSGTVLQDVLPDNPYADANDVQAATWAVTPPVSGTAAWNYDAAAGKFWANSNTVGENEF